MKWNNLQMLGYIYNIRAWLGFGFIYLDLLMLV